MTHGAKCAVAAVHLWCYWCSNYYDPNTWIYEIWGQGCTGDHMMEKFTKECDCNMTKFYRELSSDNQELLTLWVLTNYKP